MPSLKDIKRAFLSVNHNILRRKLKPLGMSSKVIRILIYLYSRAKIMVKNSQGLSESIDLTIGVLQGEVLRPILFALFMADLEHFLKSRGITGIEHAWILTIILLAYADDSVFTALTIEEINKILNLLNEYCENNDLTVNSQH